MPEKPETPDTQYLDDKLADYTDRLLDGSMDAPPPELAEDDAELRAMQEVTAQLWQAFGKDDPQQAMTTRIHNVLSAKWQVEQPKEKAPQPSIWQKLKTSFSQQRHFATFAMATMAVIVVLGIFFLTIPETLPLEGTAIEEGTAIGSGFIVPLGIVVGVLITAYLLLSSRDE